MISIHLLWTSTRVWLMKKKNTNLERFNNYKNIVCLANRKKMITTSYFCLLMLASLYILCSVAYDSDFEGAFCVKTKTVPNGMYWSYRTIIDPVYALTTANCAYISRMTNIWLYPPPIFQIILGTNMIESPTKLTGSALFPFPDLQILTPK